MKRKFYASFMLFVMAIQITAPVFASSHREAPLIADDRVADNTDVYAFRSPDDPNKITIIANYIPGQLPQDGPNYHHFSENVRYEIHIDNNIGTKGDDIIYRFSFSRENEDPTTFFNIRLGKQNLKTTYKMERSVDGGKHFQTVVNKGIVPPPNIGPRSISSPVGLSAPDYNTLMTAAITTSKTGEKVFCGPVDDPFFVDLGGIFDLGDAPRASGKPIDGLKCINVSTIALQIDISTLQKDHKPVSQCTSILDPNYVIGVWASASRQQITILNNGKLPHFRMENNGDDNEGSSNIEQRTSSDDNFVKEYHAGPWVQVSRLGMPLTNEAVVPVGYKDLWNSLTPYQDLSKLSTFGKFFYKPELALYMDDKFYGGAVPSFAPLRIQRSSLGAFGFGNDQDGLFGLKGNAALNGTALAESAFGGLLLPAKNSPRSVDLWPIFHTGVPNLAPYQLATGKPAGNPLAKGKPFISNFLPNGGDMLRLNMAVPPTPRDSKNFSSLGLVQAAVTGLTDPAYANTGIQNIPNMDGFPNGRRLEDDVTRIELQAVGGVVLAAIGLWYDDYTVGGSPVTAQLGKVLSYTTGVEKNDAPFTKSFPYMATPWAGSHVCDCGDGPVTPNSPKMGPMVFQSLDIATPVVIATTSPNPFVGTNTIRYHVAEAAQINISLYDVEGHQVKVMVNKMLKPGTYNESWNGDGLIKGVYFIKIVKDGVVKQNLRVVKG
ncbi:MAG: DUF4331 family protein [Ferruginibacter sp.]